MNMAIRELKVLADDLASVYQNDPYRTDSTDGLSGLENIFSDINSFAYTLEERALTTGSGKVVSRALIDLHCREIKRAASNALGNVAHYEHFGHYGFAHVLYMETLLSQSTITDDEAHYFIKGRVQFLAETEQVLQQSNWEMWTPMLARLLHSQIFIPRVLLENTVIREHVRELRTPDCLGRSVSHILSDAGHAFEWPVAEAQYVDVLGRSVLYVACSNGNKALATDLIENGRVDTHKALNGLAPLHIAAYMGHASICELICKTCPDIKHHFLDRSGRSPLLWAALRGHLDTVRRLWKLFPSSVLLNIAGNQWIDRDGFGSTALILSSYGGHISVIKYLLARVLPFANFLVNTRDTRGQNAYTYAHQGSHLEIMALLRSYNRLPRKQPVLLDQAASVHLAYLDEFTQEHAMGPVCS
jgi:ankyrin repeat protein